MANDSKYGRLYPERAVALLRRRVEETLETYRQGGNLFAVGYWEEALKALDELSFPPDEPLFLLRGQDELARDTVREYIRLVESEEGAFSGNRHATINHLYKFVDRMERWNPRKLPD